MKRRINLFLSYSTKDKKYAKLIKDEFEQFGINVFLAHEDIKVSKRWRQRIWEELKNSQIYVPVLTKNFKMSDWAEQEAGIAIANGLDCDLPVGQFS